MLFGPSCGSVAKRMTALNSPFVPVLITLAWNVRYNDWSNWSPVAIWFLFQLTSLVPVM